MPAPKGVTWPLEPHTAAKHAILEKYLQAWLPIMTTYHGRVVFLDAFSGPGEYSGGERGSPLIALDAVLNHTYGAVRNAQIEFVFVESDPARCAHLDVLLSSRTSVPAGMVRVECGECVQQVPKLLLKLVDRFGHPVPLFAFLDPFGYSDTPMDLVARILHLDKSEVLINFMHENINRFATSPDPKNQAHLDALFGTPAWRQIFASNPSPVDRERRLHELYQEQLRTLGGAKYVRSFRMRNKQNKTEYYLFFATKSLKGLDKMKEAMWKVDPSGAFDFSDFTDPSQLVLFVPEPDRHLLERLLRGHFGGQTVTVQEVEEYVIAETPFYSGQYKPVLKALELAGELVAFPMSGKRRPRGTYADQNMPVRFA